MSLYYEPNLWCRACHDAEVEHEGDVCQACLRSTPADWISPQTYAAMRTYEREMRARQEAAA